MTNRNIKTIRRKIWWRDNILMVIVAAMFAGYFTYDLSDKQINREEHKAIKSDLEATDQKVKKLDNQLYTVCIILINNPNTDPELKDILKDYVKNISRGSSI